MKSHCFAMFRGYWSSASGDIKYLICHVISQKHVIEGSSNYQWEFFMIYHHLAKFDGPRYSSRDMFLVRHVIKQDHGMKGPGDYNDKNPSR